MRTKGSVIRTMAMGAALMLVLTVGSASAQKLNLCYIDWPPFEFLRGMESLGQLNDFKVVNEKYETCLFGAKTGQYDITFFTLFEFIEMQHESSGNVVAIGAMDYSNGGDMIVLRPEIKSASELKGKSIALQTDTTALNFLYLYLMKNSMTLDDVKLVHIPAENLSKAFLATKSLAGIVSWTPLTDKAVAGGGRIAADSRDFPHKMIDVIIVNRDSLKKNRAVYKDFLKKWFAAIHNPAVLEKTAEHAKMSVDEFKKQLATVVLYPDISSDLQVMDKIKKETVPELQALFKTKPANIPGAAARFFGKEPVNADSWFDDSLLRELLKEQQ